MYMCFHSSSVCNCKRQPGPPINPADMHCKKHCRGTEQRQSKAILFIKHVWYTEVDSRCWGVVQGVRAASHLCYTHILLSCSLCWALTVYTVLYVSDCDGVTFLYKFSMQVSDLYSTLFFLFSWHFCLYLKERHMQQRFPSRIEPVTPESPELLECALHQMTSF